MRAALVVGILCLLAIAVAMFWRAGGGAEEAFDVTIPTLPGRTHLEMRASPPNRRWQYRLVAKSHVRKTARLAARFEDPAPAGMHVVLADPEIPREGTAYPTLVFVAPSQEGTFAGAVLLTCEEAPGWRLRYTFEGDVQAAALGGARLRARPRASADLGSVTPGERRPFVFALEAFGSEQVTIQSVRAVDPELIRLAWSGQPETVRAGGEYQLQGEFLAPKTGGPFRSRIQVFSDAENYPRAMDLWVTGRVIPDYSLMPPELKSRVEFPSMERSYRIFVRAREGIPPFRIGEVQRHERYFTVEGKGSEEPAMEQELRLKVRRDAPTNALQDTVLKVLVTLEPGGHEVVLPIAMRFYARIYPQPPRLAFGVDTKPREIRLLSFPGLAYEVKRAYSERGRFAAILKKQGTGMTPTILVSVKPGTPSGIHNDRIVIETDDPDVPQLIVPVTATVP